MIYWNKNQKLQFLWCIGANYHPWAIEAKKVFWVYLHKKIFSDIGWENFEMFIIRSVELCRKSKIGSFESSVSNLPYLGNWGKNMLINIFWGEICFHSSLDRPEMLKIRFFLGFVKNLILLISFGLIYHIWAIEAKKFLVHIDKKYSLMMSGTDY